VTVSRRLVVLRHGKAEPFAASDFDRVLTDAGRRASLDAGRHLTTVDAVPDHAVVSPAARARQTWEAAAEGSGSSATVAYDDALYAGGPELALETLRSVPPEAGTVAFVGHNPTVAYLVNLLEDGTGDPEVSASLLAGYPPGAVAVLEVEGPWMDLDVDSARLVDYYVGRGGK
jgi:phosphohistidine phosphatase